MLEFTGNVEDGYMKSFNVIDSLLVFFINSIPPLRPFSVIDSSSTSESLKSELSHWQSLECYWAYDKIFWLELYESSR